MNSLGNKIFEARKAKGLTQEELAELSKVNLRTIQRIENNENEPRGKTLKLICDVLQVESDNFKNIDQTKRKDKFSSAIVNGVYLVLFNLSLIFLLAFLTLDSNANINSRVGAFLLSLCVPFFIVVFTQKMSETERLLKFGAGFVAYIIMRMILNGFQDEMRIGLGTGLFFCIIISIGILYYGKTILKLVK